VKLCPSVEQRPMQGIEERAERSDQKRPRSDRDKPIDKSAKSERHFVNSAIPSY
jgi:hypothetical protein